MIFSYIFATFTHLLEFIQSNKALNEGLRFLLVGIALELSRRGAAYLVHSAYSSVVATARISEGDDAFDWLYTYLSMHSQIATSSNSADSSDPSKPIDGRARFDKQGRWIAKHSFWDIVRDYLYPTSNGSVMMDVQLATKRPRHFTHYLKPAYTAAEHAQAKSGGYGFGGGGEFGIDVVPSYGQMQRISYRGKTIKMGVIQEEGNGYQGGLKWIIMESYFTTPEIFNYLVLDARALFQSMISTNTTSVYTPDFSHGTTRWSKHATKNNRSWDSIFLDANIKEWILNDATEFLKEQGFYEKRGIPYRRGYMCFGVAGSGKSSMIGALAGKLGLDIYLISLGARQLDDDGLQSLLRTCPGRCLLLMEDIDCAFTTKSPNSMRIDPTADPAFFPPTPVQQGPSARISEKTITLSGLLNAIDGVASSEGRLLFCTTNLKDKIDPALSRPGRCDIWIEFKNATKSQAKSLFEYFYDSEHEHDPFIDASHAQPEDGSEAEEEKAGGVDQKTGNIPVTENMEQLTRKELSSLAEKFSSEIPEDKISVSAIQGYLMRYKRDPRLALKNVKSWIDGGCGQGSTPLLHDGKVEMKSMIRDAKVNGYTGGEDVGAFNGHLDDGEDE
ncbi:uncharacterized protein I303_106242 [Kwoniella dejecticola CBS 10117]|uniref:AAA+ ATPase domain-containing protein n=1 Tax=Kwoniella dejecticola CBS 10117 TaxID=1296121 RepID=A0A1A6A1P3_9TREE|nr:uncharacterized protein I303_06261 [Kwoniella dejecticola CBS 10117]OBR83974.1 hypothetical protein I303_06261 [Kwoniella dejecticola CBS 10117]